MRRVVVLLVGTVFSLIFFAFATAWAQAPPWTLAWSDEFNGTAIDTTAWNVENSAYPSTDYGGVLQYWLPANVIVGNGNLRLASLRQSMGGLPYTSGAVTTKGKVEFSAPTRIEIRAKLPKGRGVWPAVWTLEEPMQSPDNGAEIDLLEMMDGTNPHVISMSHQSWGTAANDGNQTTRLTCQYSGPDYSADFHTFAVEIVARSITWFIDGVQRCGPSTVGVPTHPSYLLLNTSIGAGWAGGPVPDASTVFPQYFDIDYVRIYHQTAVLDTQPPSVPTGLTAKAISSSQISLAWTASTDNVGVAGYQVVRNGTHIGTTSSTTYTDTGLTAGTTYAYAVAAYDATGNTSALSSPAGATAPGADTTRPTVTITAPTSATTYSTSSGTLSLVGTASDNVGVSAVTWSNSQGGSGTASGTTSWTVSGLALQSGSNVLTVSAKDAAGNTGTATLTVSYTPPPDTTAPSVKISAPTTNTTYSTTSSSLTLSGTAADDVGVSAVTWSNSRGGSGAARGTTSWTVSRLTLQSGSNVLTVSAKDAAGNTGTATLTVTYTAPDTQAPSVPTGLTATAIASAQISLAWAASTDNVGVNGYQVFRGGTQVGATPTTTYTDTGLTAGTTYIYTVAAYDAAGNTSALSAGLSVTTASQNTTPPSGSLTIDANAAATNSTAATLTLAATDSVGMTGYYLATSATPPRATAAGWVPVTATPSFSSAVAYTLSGGDGTKTVYAWYKDAAGNVSPMASASILLDQTPPSNGTLTATAGNAQVSLGWSGFADSGSGLASANPYKLVVATGGSPARSCTSGTQVYSGTGTSYTHTGLTNGTTYAYRVCATDTAGNTSTGATASVTPQAPDTTPPTVTTVTPPSGSTAGGTAVTITGTNFAAGATVTIGGTAATAVTVVSSTSITATTPAHAAGAVPVVVTNPGNLSGTLATGFTYGGTYSLFAGLTPVVAADPEVAAVELGVKFRSTVAGRVTGVRFYKSTTNTGTHVGSLWSSTGTLLGRVTFTNETASGWQQADFATPVAIAANTTYVISYHLTVGHYADDQNYFATARTNGPLTALANGGATGVNGVYGVGANPVFPTLGWNSSNYWVDVVFTTP